MKFVERIIHPETNELYQDVFEDEFGFYFDEEGDRYDDELGGIEELRKDVNRILKEKYNGTYYEQSSMELSEKQYRGYF